MVDDSQSQIFNEDIMDDLIIDNQKEEKKIGEEIEENNEEEEYKEESTEPVEKDEPKEEEEKEEVEEETEEEESESGIGLLSNFFKDNEVLEQEKEIKSYGDLVEAFKEREDNLRSNLVKELPEDLKLAYDAYKSGVDYRQYFSKEETTAVDYGKIEENDIDKDAKLAEDIIKEDMKRRGFSDEEINENVDLYKDSGVIKNRALKSKERLEREDKETLKRKAEQFKAQKEEMVKRQEEYRKEITNYMNNTDNMFGNNISKRDVKRIEDYMTNNTKQLGDTAVTELEYLLTTDPTVIVQLNYLMSIGALGKNANYSKLASSKKKELMKDLDDAIRSSNKMKGSKKRATKKEDDFFGIVAEDIESKLRRLKT